MTKEQFESLKPGQRIFANGYEGSFLRHYFENIIEIRLPGGVAAIDYHEVKLVEK